ISAESEAHGSGRRAPGSRARNDVRRRGDDMQSADKPHASDIHKAYGYDIRDDVHDIYGRLTRLGLAAHALELDIKGLTVIPPETVRAPGILERAREAFLKTYERRHGDRLDYQHAETLPAALGSPIGKHMAWMLLEDP